MTRRWWSVATLCTLLCGTTLSALASNDAIDPEALIEKVLQVYHEQRDRMSTVSWESEYLRGKMKDGELRPKLEVDKIVTVKHLPDTTWLNQQVLTVIKDERDTVSFANLDSEGHARALAKTHPAAIDLTVPILQPFEDDSRTSYSISYLGIVEGINGIWTCHRFLVEPIEPADSLYAGEYFFEAESFALARVELAPSELGGSLFYRLNRLDMTLVYAPYDTGYWLPERLDIRGGGKRVWLFGVSFASTEFFRRPLINDPAADSVFLSFNNSAATAQDTLPSR